MKKKTVGIIGGGIGGLVAGLRLCQKGYKVTIFEKGEVLGGLLAGFKVEGTNLERAYHHIFESDKEVIGLIKELGLSEKMVWKKGTIGVYWQKEMWPFNGPVDLLRFGAIPLLDRIRMGLVGLWLQKDENYQKYIKVTAVSWMKKWVGKAGFEVVWEPLLRAKFGEDYDKVSMAWLWARIHTRSSKLGYLLGGFEQITNRLAEEIKKAGGVIKLKTEVDLEKVKKDFDLVINTGPVPRVKYLGAVIVAFTSSQNLSQYYWHNINDPQSPFLAFIQHTNLVDKSEYGGKHVYYMGAYLSHDDHRFEADEETIKKDFHEYLKRIFADFDPGQIDQEWVFRFKNAQHVVTTDYQEIINKTKKTNRTDKIINLNFAMIFPQDRGINYAVREAERLIKCRF
ncbi:MAG: FAD-dependent oxidoreductase [Candidatus Shapirobacteria bacterium]